MGGREEPKNLGSENRGQLTRGVETGELSRGEERARLDMNDGQRSRSGGGQELHC